MTQTEAQLIGMILTGNAALIHGKRAIRAALHLIHMTGHVKISKDPSVGVYYLVQHKPINMLTDEVNQQVRLEEELEALL